MNLFNRLVTIVVLVVVWVTLVALAAAPSQALAWAQAGLDRLAQWLAGLETLQPAWLYALVRVGTVVLSTLILLGLLWLELRRGRVPTVRVVLPSGGQATVTAESVERRLAWHIDQLADVIEVYPRVQPHGTSLDVRLDLETSPEVDIPLKSEEVMALTREVVEQQMGLQLRHIKVEVRHADFPEPVPTSSASTNRKV